MEIGKEAGLSDSDIEAVRSGNASDEFDRALLRAVDELDEKTNIPTRPGQLSANGSTSGSGWI